MKLQKFILAAALGICSISAFADWQPYVGAGLGLTSSSFNTNIPNPALLSQAGPNSNGGWIDSNPNNYNFLAQATTVTPEIHLGIANQYNKFYLGFEGSVQYNNNWATSNTVNDVVTTVTNPTAVFNSKVVSSLQWNTSLTTQLGYFVTPDVMPYAKIGITAAQGDVSESINSEAIPQVAPVGGIAASTHASPWMFGPTISLGVQYTITQHLRGFAQGNYTYLWGNASPQLSYNNTVMQQWIANPIATAPRQNYTYSAWTFEIGTNYYF
jgi:opacity protein-like surface antigen